MRKTTFWDLHWGSQSGIQMVDANLLAEQSVDKLNGKWVPVRIVRHFQSSNKMGTELQIKLGHAIYQTIQLLDK